MPSRRSLAISFVLVLTLVLYWGAAPRVVPCGESGNVLNFPEAQEISHADVIVLIIAALTRWFTLWLRPRTGSTALTLIIHVIAASITPFSIVTDRASVGAEFLLIGRGAIPKILLRERDSEMVIRVLLAGISILIGTTLWFVGATLFNTVDGELSDSSVLAPGNVLFYLTPPVVALLYVYLTRELRIPSWGFAILCCFWALRAIGFSFLGDFTCTSWHMGDVLCGSSNDLFLLLWGGDLSIILSGAIAGRWLTRKPMLAMFSTIVFFWLAFSVVAIAIHF